MRKKGRIGSSFDDFLKEEGIHEEVTARAIKRLLARQRDALIQEGQCGGGPLKTDKMPPDCPP